MGILGLSITDTTSVVQGAGFGIRALARVLEMVYGYVLGIISGIAGAIFLVILQEAAVIGPGWQRRLGGARLGLFMASLVGNLFYHTLCEGICGASLGKLICGLRVVTEDLAPCSIKQAFIRSCAYFIDSLFFGIVGYLEMNKTLKEQRHGDHWAKTLVVRRRLVPDAAKASPVRMLFGIAAGSFAWSLFLIATLVIVGIRS